MASGATGVCEGFVGGGEYSNRECFVDGGECPSRDSSGVVDVGGGDGGVDGDDEEDM